MNCGACGGVFSNDKIYVKSAIDQTTGTFGVCNFCGSLRVLDKIDYDKLYSTRESSNYPDKVGILVTLKQFLMRKEARSIIQLASTSSARILDYGCGGGEFANAIRKISSLTVHACDMQSDRPSSLMADIPYISVADIGKSDNFDIVVLRHVLEHMEYPRHELEIIAKKLTPQGQIFIEVPSTQSLFRILLGSRWPGYFFPFHVHVFSEKGLIELAAQSGLIVKSIKRCNFPIFGVFFMKFGVGRTYARILSALLYPVQCMLNYLTNRHEAVQIVLKK